MPPEANESFLTPKINGEVPDGLMSDIDEIIVDSSLHLPDMFTIRLQDPKLEWVDNSIFDFGKPVEITAQAAAEIGGGKGTLMTGAITALEPEFSAVGTHMLTIRGYDKTSRLHLSKISRTFAKQKDSDMARTIASEAGLTPDIDTTSVQYEYVMQNNQTNMEFLAERARRIGFQVFALDGKLYFKKGDFSLPGIVPILTLGTELRSFRPRMTVATQASKVRVLGWDAKGKKVIKSEAGPNANWNQGGATKTGGAAAKSAFGNKELWAVIADRPVATVDEAQALAEGLANDISSEFIEAEGVCFGNPVIKAGMKVKLEGLGKRFSGKYFVTSATHIFHAGGYETHFTVSGRQPNTINHLLDHRYHTNGNGGGRVEGVVVGLVTNLNDELNLGRVKVKFPWLIDNKSVEIESAWAKISSPMAGQDTKGFYYLPEINDEVLVAFEHGDVNRPYIVGVLWNSTDKPPLPNNQVVKAGKVVQRIIRSRVGHMIVFDDSTDKPSILIVDKTGENSIFIDSTKNAMDIKVKGNLTIDVGGDIAITAKGKVSVDAMRDISETTKGQFVVQATRSANITANMDLKLNGNLTATMQGGSTAAVKGGVAVNIEGSVSTNITGGIIKLN